MKYACGAEPKKHDSVRWTDGTWTYLVTGFGRKPGTVCITNGEQERDDAPVDMLKLVKRGFSKPKLTLVTGEDTK